MCIENMCEVDYNIISKRQNVRLQVYMKKKEKKIGVHSHNNVDTRKKNRNDSNHLSRKYCLFR